MWSSRFILSCALVTVVGCGDDKAEAPSDSASDAADSSDAADTSSDGDSSGGCSGTLFPAQLEGGAYDPRFTIAGFTGFDGHSPTVYDFARDVDGSVLVVGELQYFEGARVAPLMRWKDGAWGAARDTWELTPPGAGFAAVAVDPTHGLALATYDDFGDRSVEVWVDDGSGLKVAGRFEGLIRKLRWFDGELWVAGYMQLSGDAAIHGLARWDGAEWHAAPGGAVDGNVFELEPDGDGLLVGGGFAHIGGIAAANVARFESDKWTALDFPDVAIYALARDAGGELYAGGTFGEKFGATGGIAHWVDDAWELAAGGLGNRFIIGVANDLELHDGSLFVSGCFYTAGGTDEDPDAVVATGIARYDGQWHSLDDGTKGALGPWVEPRACGDEGPGSVWDVSKQRLFSDGDHLWLGGSFPGVGGILSQSIVALGDGDTWTAQGRGGLGLGGALDRIGASASCDVWASGQVTHAGTESGATRANGRLLHFGGSGWEPVDDSAIPSDAFCGGFAVSPDGTATLGCFATSDGGDAAGRLYSASAGTALAQVGGDLPLIQVLAYADDGTLWVGGGGETGFVGTFDGTELNIIEDDFDAPVTLIDPVAGEDNVIVAGYFTRVGAVGANRIARRREGAWQALADGLPATAAALAHDDAKVYVSTYDEGAGMLMLGAFDGVAWSELATAESGLTPQSVFNFNAIRVVGDALVAVGTAPLDHGPGRGALVFRDGHFSALGGGVRASYLSGIAVTSDAIWIAGAIAEAGPADALVSTIGVARYVIAR